MSTNNYIMELLKLEDQNIECTHVYTNSVDKVATICIEARLTNKPGACPKCGGIHINIHGYKVSTIKIMPISGYPAVLKLSKQRYKCMDCDKTFVAKTSIVRENCYISNNVKNAAILKAVNIISEKDIAKELNISNSTVNREISKSKDDHKINIHYLPEVLCIDEFKSTKDAAGSMSFIYCDAKKRRIIDIVENRQLAFLKTYFYRYTRKARKKVKFVVMDMYKPYVSLVKELFPNAKIIFDKFHVINNLSKALDKTRIALMKKADDKAYRKLKRYGRLLLKDKYDLDGVNFKKQRCFDKAVSQEDIVDCLLDLDEELKRTYSAYQNILSAIKRKDVTALEQLLDEKQPEVSSYMKTALKTSKTNKEYILNSVRYGFTNGIVEGFNNKIKALKRIAFGYRSFLNFRNRILISSNLISTKKRRA